MMQTESGYSRSLSLLLRGLSESDTPVHFMTNGEGENPNIGLRSVISLQNILLPQSLINIETGGLSVLERARVAHAAAHLLYSVPARDVSRLKPMGIAVVSAIEDARVEYLLMKRFPGVRRWFCEAMQAQSIEQDAFSSLIAKLAHGLFKANAHSEEYWVNKARDLFFSLITKNGPEDYEGYRAIAAILANDLGQMRIQFNAQAYINPVVYRDDNSYLWNFDTQKSEPELSIGFSQSVLKPVPLTESTQGDRQDVLLNIEAFHYPEWDYRSDIERKDWCTVIEYRGAQSVADSGSTISRYSTQNFLRLSKNNARALSRDKLFRQQEGDALDMNAVIDSVALARQMGDSDQRHYIRPSLRKKNLSLLLMLDLSASVGAWVGDACQSILDLEKTAAMMLADIAHQQGDRIAIHGFCSDTRKGIYYYRFLDFDQPFTRSGLHALNTAGHQYSTRMGAALRHSISFFKQCDADNQAIIMMTDGAPADIDVFDPGYLAQDARRVVVDSIKKGIDIYGLVLSPDSVDPTKKIFGSSRHRIVSRVQSLSIQLESLYLQIKS